MKRIVFVLLSMGIAGTICAQAPADTAGRMEVARMVVAPYIQNVTDTSFHVLCETSAPMKAQLYIGVAEFNVLKPTLQLAGEERAFSQMHTLHAGGLKKGGRYFYQVKLTGPAGDTLSSEPIPFDVPDYDRMPVTFAVVGDTQHDSATWGKIAGLIGDERPSFIVHGGDMVEYGPRKECWTNEFFRPASQLLRYYPLYPAIGNHEMNNAFYYQYLDLPGSEDFYSIVKGDVLFVFINTNKDILPGSVQYRQLERLLAASPQRWKIVVHHQPVYTSAARGYGDSWVGQTLRGDPNTMHLSHLFEQYRVDLDINGHMHCYERTWPLTNEQVDVKGGVTYLTSGGGGGRLEEVAANKRWYDAKTGSEHHFVMVNIAGNMLYGRAIDIQGRLFDVWQREKAESATLLNAPLITGERLHFYQRTVASIENLNHSGQLSYRTGQEKVIHAGHGKEVRLTLAASTKVTAFVQGANGDRSRVAEKVFIKLPLWPAGNVSTGGKARTAPARAEVICDYYEGFITHLPDFNQVRPLRSFSTDSVSLAKVLPGIINWHGDHTPDHWAARFRGDFYVPGTDVYRLLLESYDGSRLFIDGKEVIDNDGMHYEIKKENFVALEKGRHSFEVRYFHFTRRATLRLAMGVEGGEMKDFNEFLIKSLNR